MPQYIVCARKHFDDGGFSLLYGTPFSPDYDTPKLYFQPQTLLLGLLLKTGLDAGLVWIGFGVVAGTVCVRIALSLIQWHIGLQGLAHWLVAVCFVWGGGFLVAAGSLEWFLTGDLDQLFRFDPGAGMWCLNLGRNLIYPYEAYYHALFLGCILCLLKRQNRLALFWAAVLSLSHPFTGVQLLCVVFVWALFERQWMGNPEIRWGLIGAAMLLLALHFGYYLGLLNLSHEHRSIQRQFAQPWTYEAQHFVPAYLLVGLMAGWQLRTPSLAGEFFSREKHRLFAIWAAVSFALANHEFAIQPPVQPVHFARGYVWIPLFLMGAQALLALFRYFELRKGLLNLAATAALLTLLLMDNAVFLSTFHARSQTSKGEIYLSPDFISLTGFLNHPDNRGALLLTPARIEGMFPHFHGYLLTAYAPLRPWTGHAFNTPFMEQRYEESDSLLKQGIYLPEWRRRLTLLVLPAELSPQWLSTLPARQVYQDKTYRVYRVEPHASPAR